MKVIAKQENEDGSKTVVVQSEGDQAIIYTGLPPHIKRTDTVTKDKLRETLAKIKKDGVADIVAMEKLREKQIREDMERWLASHLIFRDGAK